MTLRIRQSVPLLLFASALGTSVAVAAPAADAATGCKVVIPAQPWKVKGFGSGDKYEVTVTGAFSCEAATAFVKKVTTEKQTSALFKGPAGFTCVAAGSKIFGDSLIYMGSCQREAPGKALLIWRPKP
jgi:hypothetical protein